MVDAEVYCIVHDCPNSSRNHHKRRRPRLETNSNSNSSNNVQYYRFPLDNLDLLNKWLRVLFPQEEANNNNNNNNIVGEKSRICEMHFTTEDFLTSTGTTTSEREDEGRENKQLNTNAIPSVFNTTSSSSSYQQSQDDDEDEDEDEDELKSSLSSSSSSSSSTRSRSQSSSPSSSSLQKTSLSHNNGDKITSYSKVRKLNFRLISLLGKNS